MGLVRMWRRDLFPAERRVNFKVLEERWDTAEKDFIDAIAPILSQMLDRLLSDVQSILETKNYAALKDIQVGYRGKLVNTIRQQMLDAFTMGKSQVFSEFSIRKDADINSQEKQYFAAKAEAIVTDIFDRVRSTTIYTVLAGIRAGKTIPQILFDIKGEAFKGELVNA